MNDTDTRDVWQLLEDAPVTLADTAALYHWSTNYDTGDGPFALFLDMIGWSDDELGQAIYGPTIRYAENIRTGSWDERLGYEELNKLGRALMEYATRPHDVRQFVDELMLAEGRD